MQQYSGCKVYRVNVSEQDRLEDWLNHEGRPVGPNTARAIFSQYNPRDDFVAGRVAYLPDLNGDEMIMGERVTSAQEAKIRGRN